MRIYAASFWALVEVLSQLEAPVCLDVETNYEVALVAGGRNGPVEGKLLLQLRVICGVQRILGQPATA